MTPVSSAAATARDGERTLVASVAGTFLVLAVYTVPLTTLGRTAADLHATPSSQAWILSSMSVGLAAALLPSGAIADDYGRRRVFVLGLTLMTLASVVAALSPTMLAFVLARVLQGIGGAAVISCSLGLLGHAFPEADARARATGYWGASLGAGIAVGPLAAAGLEAPFGWRASHWVAAALSAVVATIAASLLTESKSPKSRPVDYLGTALLALGLSSLLAGLVVGRGGWARASTVGLLGSGVLLLLGFVATEARSPRAMLNLALFRRAEFVRATLAALANGLGIIALMSFVPNLIVRGLGQKGTTAALVLLAWSGVSILSALHARRLSPSISGRRRLVLSLLGVAVGQLGLVGLSTSSSVLRLLPGMGVAGVASGYLNAALAKQAVTSVPTGSGSLGSGANNTARYVGAALGVTVVVVLAGRSEPSELVAGWNVAALVSAGLSVLGAVAVGACDWE